MSKKVTLSVTDLYFNHTAVGTQTEAQTVTIRNTGTELIQISSIDTTTNFLFRETGVPPYANTLIDKKIGKVFVTGTTYYTDSYGNLTTDPTITGNVVGFGGADENLLVNPGSFILDHTGTPILDHTNTGIYDS